MANNLRRLAVLTTLIGVMLLAVALIALSYVEVGIANEIEPESLIYTAEDISAVPQSVAEDASRLAAEMFGNNGDRYEEFVTQLLDSYVEANDKDFIVLFNPGGWGWSFPDSSTGWRSILDGIEVELDSLGYEAVLLNFQRTSETTWGVMKEFMEAAFHYPSKTKDLACRVAFLTGHCPDLKVIVAGESNGSIVSDGAMKILQDNPQVYCIQTGTPFWHRPVTRERTLVLNSNGVIPDSFSRGDIPTMARASLKSLLGIAPEEKERGTIFNFVKAPGHYYSWRYPYVYSQITEFLEENFGINQEEAYSSGGS